MGITTVPHPPSQEPHSGRLVAPSLSTRKGGSNTALTIGDVELSRSAAQHKLGLLAEKHASAQAKAKFPTMPPVAPDYDQRSRSKTAIPSTATSTTSPVKEYENYDELPDWVKEQIETKGGRIVGPAPVSSPASVPMAIPGTLPSQALFSDLNPRAEYEKGIPPPDPLPPITLAYPYNLPQHAAPSSPRTTRQMMLRSEISESLRQNLLWSRQLQRNDILGPRRRSIAAPGERQPVLQEGFITAQMQQQQQQLPPLPPPLEPFSKVVQIRPKRTAFDNPGGADGNSGAGPSTNVDVLVSPTVLVQNGFVPGMDLAAMSGGNPNLNMGLEEQKRPKGIRRNNSWGGMDDFHAKGW